MNWRILDLVIRQFPFRFRKTIYKRFGMEIGGGTAIGRGCVVDNPGNISIGRNNDFNFNCEFHTGENGCAKIKIGDNNWVGCSVKFITITHELGDQRQRAGQTVYKSINIGNGNWIGANTMILPGVIIENSCVIAAGSVVTSKCISNGLYAGVPAKRVKELK